MTTALDIITGSARLLGVVRKGEALTGDEAVDGLEMLNDLLASWTNNGLLVTSRTWESFTVASAASYTIGTGQTLNTARPLKIANAFWRVTNTDCQLAIISDAEYQQISYKTLATGYPEYLNYDNGYPAGKIRLYPQGSGELHLLSEKPLTAVAALSTTVDLPPGWNRAFRANLAIEMAAEYGVSVPAEVVKIAQDSLSSIQLAIAKQRPIKSQQSSVNMQNIYSGY